MPQSSTDDSINLSSSSSPAASRKPIMLGKFRLLAMLGQGAMGKVVRAEDSQLKRHVALKCLPRQKGPPNYRVEQFIREARSAATLEHPAIVQIYEVGEAAGHHYIAMELIEGGDLASMIKAAGPLDLHRACQLAAEAAEGLAYAAQCGITHRDIKPQNLMLTRAGRCKIADFGLARIDDPSDTFTIPKGAVGTPAYMAPEVVQRQTATAKSDVYSLGCVLFFLLSGRAPFVSRNREELLRLQVDSPVPSITEVRPDLPESLAKVLAAALSKNPDDRPSADTFAKQLRAHTIPVNASGSQIITNSSSPFLSALPGTLMSHATKNKTALMYGTVAGGIAAVLAITIALIFVSRSNHPQPAAAAPTPAAVVEAPVAAPAAPAPAPAPVVAAPVSTPVSAPAPALFAEASPAPLPASTGAPVLEPAPPSTVNDQLASITLKMTDAQAFLTAAKEKNKISTVGTVANIQVDPAQRIATLTFAGNPDLRVIYAGRLYGSMTRKFGGKDGSGLLNKNVRLTGYAALVDNHPEVTLTSSTQIDLEP